MIETYIEPTQENGAAFIRRNMKGAVEMLNLLRFRETADYSSTPELAPQAPITGEQAYQRYMKHTRPFLAEAGGELLYMGTGGQYLVGPTERWDLVLLVRHRSVEDFMAFAQNKAYLAGIGHRIAALEDSRLLPLTKLEI